MVNEKLLTAIIFTYNHKTSIAKCIESIVEQETNYKYEIHVWDDCSIDGTSDICRLYAKKYPDKILLYIQKENTFLKSDLELQSYSAISNIKTKYFSIIDGDDYWYDKNKIQIALDFLENNPKYVGFAHDTKQVNNYDKTELSYINDLCKIKVKNPVYFGENAPFFLTSSRIFRSLGYDKLKILPIDYLVYYYHLSKGPIYYKDKIMASYTISQNSTFANRFDVKHLNAMFPYKLGLVFNFQRDNFCTSLLKKYEITNGVGKHRYYMLILFKILFGVKKGWKFWFIIMFVWRYGWESLQVNYVYNRKLAKDRIDGLYLNPYARKKLPLRNLIKIVVWLPVRAFKLIVWGISNPRKGYNFLIRMTKQPKLEMKRVGRFLLSLF